MRKLNKLAAAITVALSAGVMAPQAHAVISAHYDQEGDAMLFPLFYGVLENYYAIHNNSNLWVQGHLRFRGAAWSGELLDKDIILSPHDVFVFRVTDMDQDGYWEVDQSLDPNNFMYTGHANATCSGNVPENTGSTTTVAQCQDFSDVLFPTLTGSDGGVLDPANYPNINDQIIADQKAYGYIEYIGEAVLVGCDTPESGVGEGCDLDGDGDNQNDWPLDAWDWSDAEANGDVGVAGTLDGVGNWLSGQFWISLPGSASTGVSGAALMFRDFRTASPAGTHRVEHTYPWDTEVILHTDNPAIADAPYVYRFGDEDAYENDVSFNNTWGPTLADGDDYDLGVNAVLNYTVLDATGTTPTPNYGNSVRQTLPTMGNVAVMNAYSASGSAAAGADFWDDLAAVTGGVLAYNRVNSIAEVDLAINKNAQSFTGHYFDLGSSNKGSGGAPLMSAYFVHFPTKFYRAELKEPAGRPYAGLSHYINYIVDYLLGGEVIKVYDVETWNTDEDYECVPGQTSIVSPTVLDPGMTGVQGFEVENCQWPFRYELNLVTIQELKSTHEDSPMVQAFTEGQLNAFPEYSNLSAATNTEVFAQSYPGLWYSFDLELGTNVDLRHWLPMIRSEWVED
jgi:hypothetical protein